MNPKYLLVLALAGLLCDSFAQQAYQTIDVNDINARVGAPTQLFFAEYEGPVIIVDTQIVEGGFEVPKGSGRHTIFAASLWMGCMDNSGQLRMFSGNDYGEETDIQPGPLMDASFYATESPKWDRLWKVTRSEIDAHRARFKEPGYEMAEVIANWPAHGDPDKGMHSNLAPFVDVNGNGKYEPAKGEFPAIKGDHTILFMFNDDKIHPISESLPMGIQVIGMLYGFYCPENVAIDQTLFLHYQIDRQLNDDGLYKDTYLGLFTDFDIGNPFDDYVGSDVMRGAFFAYNGDENDQDGNGLLGYGEHPPAQGLMVLRGPQQDHDGLDNGFGAGPNESVNGAGYGDGIADNEFLGLTSFMSVVTGGFGQPSPPGIRYYNMMQGKSPDGEYQTQIVVNDTTVVPSRFSYYGNSDPHGYATNGVLVPSGSNEESSGNVPFDRRGLGGMGPFTLDAYERVEIDLAFVYGRDLEGTALESVAEMKRRMDMVRYVYQTGITECGKDFGFYNSNASADAPSEVINVFPNPFTDLVSVQWDGQQALDYQVLDPVGKLVQSGRITGGAAALDLSAMAPGAYFLQLFNETQPQTIRLIKQ